MRGRLDAALPATVACHNLVGSPARSVGGVQGPPGRLGRRRAGGTGTRPGVADVLAAGQARHLVGGRGAAALAAQPAAPGGAVGTPPTLFQQHFIEPSLYLPGPFFIHVTLLHQSNLGRELRSDARPLPPTARCARPARSSISGLPAGMIAPSPVVHTSNSSSQLIYAAAAAVSCTPPLNCVKRLVNDDRLFPTVGCPRGACQCHQADVSGEGRACSSSWATGQPVDIVAAQSTASASASID